MKEKSKIGNIVASFPVLPRTRFTFTCDNCGGEHFETGKAWSSNSRDVSDQAFPVSKCSPPQLSHVNVNRVRVSTWNVARNIGMV